MTDYNDNEGSEIVEGKYFSVDSDVPLEPRNIKAVSQKAGQVLLTYNYPLSGELPFGFKIKRKSQEDNNEIILEESFQGLQYVDIPAEDGEYIYYVASVDYSGNCSEFISVNAVSDRSAPEIVHINNITAENDSFLIVWDSLAEKNIKYRLYAKDELIGENDINNALINNIVSNQVKIKIPIGDSKYFALSSIDSLDNVSSPGENYLFQYDNISPSANISIEPRSPLKACQMDISLSLNEEVILPQLNILLPNSENLSVDLTQVDALHYQGNILISEDLNGEAEFLFTAEDLNENIGNEILSGRIFKIDNELPLAPIYLKREVLPNSRVKLWWENNINKDAALYNIYRYEEEPDSIEVENLHAENIQEKYYFDENLTPDMTYWYAITSIDSAGNESEDYLKTSVQMIYSPPAEAPFLTVELDSIKRVVLNWNQVENGASYNIYYSPLTSNNLSNATPLRYGYTNTSLVLNFTKEDTLYFQVRALDSAGNEGALSNIAKVYLDNINPNIDFVTDTDYWIKKDDSFNITLSSHEILENIPNLKLHFSDNSEKIIELTQTGETSYSVSINVDDSYIEGQAYFSIMAEDKYENITNIAYTQEICFDYTIPSYITHLEVIQIERSVSLLWGKKVDIESYRVYRHIENFANTENAQLLTNIDDLNNPKKQTNSYIDNTCGNERYYYAVVSVDSAGNESDIDIVKSIHPDYSAPIGTIENLNYENIENKVKLTWNYDLEENVFYNIYRGLTSNNMTLLEQTNTQEYEDGPALSGTYYYAVSLEDSLGNEGEISQPISMSYTQNLPVAYISVPKNPANESFIINIRTSKAVSGVPSLSFISNDVSINTPIQLVRNDSDSLFYGQFSIPEQTDENYQLYEYWRKISPFIGQFYFSALTQTGDITEIIAEGKDFIIDIKRPEFYLTSNAILMEGTHTISFNSREQLDSLPVVTFAPLGELPQNMEVTEISENEYKFDVEITADTNDGNARIYVSGTDLAGNNGDKEFFVSVQTQLPHEPYNLRHEFISRNQVRLIWDNVPETNYHYYVYKDYVPVTSTGELTALGEIKNKKSMILELDENVGYYYAVIAKNAVGYSDLSESIQIQPDFTAPAKPINLSAEQEGKDIFLAWNKGIGEIPVSYNVYGSENIETIENNLLFGNLIAEEFIYTPNYDGTYYFSVSALDSIGNESELSLVEEVNFNQTLPQAEITMADSVLTIGDYTLALKTNKPLITLPQLWLKPYKANMLPITLSGSDTLWTGNFSIPKEISNGTSKFVFKGYDLDWQETKIIRTGASRKINTIGAKAEIITNAIDNLYVSEGNLEIKLITNHPIIPETLSLKLHPHNKLPIDIIMEHVSGDTLFQGNLEITTDTGDSTAWFEYSSVDIDGVAGEYIEDDSKSIIIDTTSPEAVEEFLVVFRMFDYSSGEFDPRLELTIPIQQEYISNRYYFYKSLEPIISTDGLEPIAIEDYIGEFMAFTKISVTDRPDFSSLYYYAVVAEDIVGHRSPIVSREKYFTNNVPNIPQNFSAEILPTGQIHCTWDAISDEDFLQYKVYYSKNFITSVKAPGVMLAGSTPFTEIYGSPDEDGLYYFVITSQNNFLAESLPSNCIVVNYQKLPPKAKINIIKSNNYLKTGDYSVKVNLTVPADSVYLAFTPYHSEENYSVHLTDDGDRMNYTGIVTITEDMPEGIAYFNYYGKGVNGSNSNIVYGDGDEGDYNDAFFFIDNTKPLAPINFDAQAITKSNLGDIKLSWELVPDGEVPLYYKIYRSINNFADSDSNFVAQVFQGNQVASEYVDIPYDEGENYYIVKAVDAAGNESVSSIVASAICQRNSAVFNFKMYKEIMGNQVLSEINSGNFELKINSSRDISRVEKLYFTYGIDDTLYVEPDSISITNNTITVKSTIPSTEKDEIIAAKWCIEAYDLEDNYSYYIKSGKTFSIINQEPIADIIVDETYKMRANRLYPSLITAPLSRGIYHLTCKTSEDLFDAPDIKYYNISDSTRVFDVYNISGYNKKWTGLIEIDNSMSSGEYKFIYNGQSRLGTVSTEIDSIEYDYEIEYISSTTEQIINTFATTGGFFDLDLVAPNIPQNMTLLNGELGTVEIRWDYPDSLDGIDYYEVYRSPFVFSTIEEADLVNEQNVCAPVWVDAPEIDGFYYYRVRAVDFAGNKSDLSNIEGIIVDSIKPDIKVFPLPINGDRVIIICAASEPILSPSLTMDFGNMSPTNITINGNFDTDFDQTLRGYLSQIGINNLNHIYARDISEVFPQDIDIFNGEVNINIHAPDFSGNVTKTDVGYAVASIETENGGVITKDDEAFKLQLPAGLKIAPISAGIDSVMDYNNHEILSFFVSSYYDTTSTEHNEDEEETPSIIDLSRHHPGINTVGKTYEININIPHEQPEIFMIPSGGGTPPATITIKPEKMTLDKLVEHAAEICAWKPAVFNENNEMIERPRWYAVEGSTVMGGEVTFPCSLVTKYTIMSEKMPPKILSWEPQEVTHSFTPEVRFKVEDLGIGLKKETAIVKIDGQEYPAKINSIDPFTAEYIVSFGKAELAPGEHRVSIYIEDVVKNSSTFSWKFTVDNLPPTIAGVYPANGDKIGLPNPIITADLSDIGGGIAPENVTLALDNVIRPFSIYKDFYTIFFAADSLKDGKHKAKLVAPDVVNEITEYEWGFWIDTTPPSVDPIHPLPDSKTNKSKYSVKFAFADSISGVDYSSIGL